MDVVSAAPLSMTLVIEPTAAGSWVPDSVAAKSRASTITIIPTPDLLKTTRNHTTVFQDSPARPPTENAERGRDRERKRKREREREREREQGKVRNRPYLIVVYSMVWQSTASYS